MVERVEFELSGDFLNGQQGMQKCQEGLKRLAARSLRKNLCQFATVISRCRLGFLRLRHINSGRRLPYRVQSRSARPPLAHADLVEHRGPALSKRQADVLLVAIAHDRTLPRQPSRSAIDE